MQLDREARALAAFRDRSLPQLARTAGAFVSRKCWFLLGYARVGDCARERLGRSGRWLRDLAALDRAMGDHPALDRAVRGTDGGPPLRRIAALIIARAAGPETIARWVAAGRTLPVRRLKAAAARARIGEDPFADERAGATCRASAPLVHDSSVSGPIGGAAASKHNPRHLAPGSTDGAPTSDDHPLGSVLPGSTSHAPAPMRNPLDVVSGSTRGDTVSGNSPVGSLPGSTGHAPATMQNPSDSVPGSTGGAAASKNAPSDSAAQDDPVNELRIGSGEAASDSARRAHQDSADRVRLRLAVPRPVAVAFDETLDLFRAISGGDVPLAEFVDALSAEGMASCWPADVELRPVGDLVRDSRREEAYEIASGDWRNLEHGPVGVGLVSDDPWLSDFQRLEQDGDGGDAGELLRRLSEWIRLEDEIERRIGRVLNRMGRCGAWHELRFAGPAHYARERLGMGRTAAENRTMLARSLDACPALRAAYEDGRLGIEATLLVRRVLSAGRVDEATERSWVAHAEEMTIRRLRDEVRPFRRARTAAPNAAPPAADTTPGPPPTDEQWYASLDRGPGCTARTVASLTRGLDLHYVPDVFLSFRLPEDVAQAFRLAIGTACAEVEARIAAGLDASTPSQLAARTFSIHDRRVPSWVGLLWLIEDFLATWDLPEDVARSRRSDAVYRRAGWRCEAPGCTSRANLEDHHVVYRSHGGSNSLFNRNCMCRCHHGPGQHGGLISVGGTAPLGLLWRLGAPKFATWYRNDRRLRPSAAAWLAGSAGLAAPPAAAAGIARSASSAGTAGVGPAGNAGTTGTAAVERRAQAHVPARATASVSFRTGSGGRR